MHGVRGAEARDDGHGAARTDDDRRGPEALPGHFEGDDDPGAVVTRAEQPCDANVAGLIPC